MVTQWPAVKKEKPDERTTVLRVSGEVVEVGGTITLKKVLVALQSQSQDPAPKKQ